MTWWQACKAAYRGSFAFLIACPLLALVPVALELVQHGIEVHIGLYDSIAAARALEHDPLRMGFGFVKVLGLILPTYWVTRFLAWRDAGQAARWDTGAVRLFLPYLLLQGVLAAVQLFVLPQTLPVLLATFIGSLVVGVLIAGWGIAAPLGNPAIGPRASASLMLPQLVGSTLFSFIAVLPLMVPHYGLGALALLGPKSLLWPILIADSLLVGWLGALLAANTYVIAVRAAKRAGVALAPAQPLA
jgi:hypothetical protein